MQREEKIEHNGFVMKVVREVAQPDKTAASEPKFPAPVDVNREYVTAVEYLLEKFGENTLAGWKDALTQVIQYMGATGGQVGIIGETGTADLGSFAGQRQGLCVGERRKKLLSRKSATFLRAFGEHVRRLDTV